MFEAHNPLPESLEAMLRSALPKRSISLGGDTRRSFNKSERVDSPSGGATIGSSPQQVEAPRGKYPMHQQVRTHGRCGDRSAFAGN